MEPEVADTTSTTPMKDLELRQSKREEVKIKATEEQLERVFEQNLEEILKKYERKKNQLTAAKLLEEERAELLESLAREQEEMEKERKINQAKAKEASALEQARQLHENTVEDLKNEAERRKAQLRAKADMDLEQFRLSLQANTEGKTKPLSRVELARQAFEGKVKLTKELLEAKQTENDSTATGGELAEEKSRIENQLEADLTKVERELNGKVVDLESKLEELRRRSKAFEEQIQSAIDRQSNSSKAKCAADYQQKLRVGEEAYDKDLEHLERQKQAEIASLAANTEQKRRMSVGEIKKLQEEENIMATHTNITQLTEEERKRRVESSQVPPHSKLDHAVVLEELKQEKGRRSSRMEKQPSLKFNSANMTKSLKPTEVTAQTRPHGHAFTEKLDAEALAFFNELTQKPFSEQAIAFLNAYWEEVGSQAEFIFSVAWKMIQYADMHTKGIQYVHLYKEGNDLDFNIGLYFYEKLCKKVLEDKEGEVWRNEEQWKPSLPTMMTAIVRKKELRDKVDVNFDGRVSFLEYLLYQYNDRTNPAEFTQRAMKHDVEEHPAITKAKKALEEVNEAIRKFEEEKMRLEEIAAKPGVKGLGAKHELAILDAGVLADDLNKSLITAEAAVRIVSRKFGGSAAKAESGEAVKPTEGSVWWLNRDLEAKKKLYGKRSSK